MKEDNEIRKKKIPQHHCRFRLKLPHFRSPETIESVHRERKIEEERRKMRKNTNEERNLYIFWDISCLSNYQDSFSSFQNILAMTWWNLFIKSSAIRKENIYRKTGCHSPRYSICLLSLLANLWLFLCIVIFFSFFI